MNRIYRLAWNRSLHTVQVASEIAKTRGARSTRSDRPRQRKLALAILASLALGACSLPALAGCPLVEPPATQPPDCYLGTAGSSPPYTESGGTGGSGQPGGYGTFSGTGSTGAPGTVGLPATALGGMGGIGYVVGSGYGYLYDGGGGSYGSPTPPIYAGGPNTGMIAGGPGGTGARGGYGGRGGDGGNASYGHPGGVGGAGAVGGAGTIGGTGGTGVSDTVPGTTFMNGPNYYTTKKAYIYGGSGGPGGQGGMGGEGGNGGHGGSMAYNDVGGKGGAGGMGGAAGTGGTGGVGLYIGPGASAQNTLSGKIVGGAGGTGGAPGGGGYGGTGGTGATVGSTSVGGQGGTGGTGGTAGAGGAGGNGVAMNGAGASLQNYGIIYGGSGGGAGTNIGGGVAPPGGQGGLGGAGAAGGAGGTSGDVGSFTAPSGAGGAGVSGSGFTLTNTDTINGGMGGESFIGKVDGHYVVTLGGLGGAGGVGYNVVGSVGGPARMASPAPYGYGGPGGAGGPGVTGSDFTVVNHGFIGGGQSGYGTTDGAPGVGLISTGDSTVTVGSSGYAASIGGGRVGFGGVGTPEAYAVEFSGGGNTLVLEDNYQFGGDVVSTSGTTNGGDTLELGGTAASSFDLSALAAGLPSSPTTTQPTKYYGFNRLIESGGVWSVTGTDALTTPWTINGGTFLLGGTSAAATSLAGSVSTQAHGIVAGSGTIDGNLDIGPSGTLEPGVPGKKQTGGLIIQAALDLEAGSTLVMDLGAPGANPSTPGTSSHITVGGKLTLGGATLNTVDVGGAGPGLYDIIDYAGACSGCDSSGLIVGSVPKDQNIAVTYTAGHVQLLDTSALGGSGGGSSGGGSSGGGTSGGSVDPPGGGSVPLTVIWAPKSGGRGGSGTWTEVSTTWTDPAGSTHGALQQPGFPIFTGTPGTVTVSNANGEVTTTGAQFERTGYVTQGAPVTLVPSNGQAPVLRVGDGTSNGATTVAVMNNPIQGTDGFTKTDVGTLVLNGTSPGLTGTTTVQAGTLIVGNEGHPTAKLGGAVTVDKGATLGGTGSVGSTTVSGTIAPSGAAGTLHVAGDTTMKPGSTLDVQAAPNGHASKVATTGKTTLQGGKVVVTSGKGKWSPTTTYTVMSSDKGVQGTFQSVSTTLAFLTPTLAYTDDAVKLTLRQNSTHFRQVAATQNQRNVATGLGGLDPSNPIYSSILTLDAPHARAGFDALDGEFAASQQTARVEDSRYVRQAMNEQLLRHSPSAHGKDAWVHVWGHWGRNGGNGDAARLSDNGSGLLIGADAKVAPNVRVGITGGASRESLSVGQRGSWGKDTSTWIGAYAGWHSHSPLSVRGGIAYSWDRLPTNRAVGYSGFHERLFGHANGHTLTAYAEGSWTFHVHGGTVSPFVNLAHTRVTTGTDREAGGPAALHVESGSMNASSATLGARGHVKLARHLDLRLKLGLQHALGSTAPTRRMRFVAGGPAFTEYGVPVARNAGVAQVGIGWHHGNVSVDGDVEDTAGGGVSDQAAKVEIKVKF